MVKISLIQPTMSISKTRQTSGKNLRKNDQQIVFQHLIHMENHGCVSYHQSQASGLCVSLYLTILFLLLAKPLPERKFTVVPCTCSQHPFLTSDLQFSCIIFLTFTLMCSFAIPCYAQSEHLLRLSPQCPTLN